MSQVEHLPSLGKREGPQWRHYLIDSGVALISTLLLTGVIYLVASLSEYSQYLSYLSLNCVSIGKHTRHVRGGIICTGGF